MRATKIVYLLPLVALLLVFSSCQKEVSFDDPIVPGGNGNGGGSGGNNTNNIVGDYDYVGMTAHTLSTVNVSQAGQNMKTVTVSDYNTKDNIGTVKITSNQMISTGVGYSIDTTMNNKTYLDGLLIDDSDFPFQVTSPASGSTSTYVRNSADSVTTTGALGFPDPSGNMPTGSVGAKLSWHGDTLYMKVSTSFTQTITQGGVPATITGSVTGITKLKKR
jgi:hypothetical protein